MPDWFWKGVVTGVFGGITLKLLQWLAMPPKEEIQKFFAKRDPGKKFSEFQTEASWQVWTRDSNKMGADQGELDQKDTKG